VSGMRRRDFVILLGCGAAAAWPLTASAQQQQAMPVIGFLGLGSPRPMGRLVAAFRQGLAKAGYVEGQNVAIEFRWADFSQSARLPALAAELVHRQVAVIFTGGFGGPAFAAKAATSTIPIVFAYGGDPVKGGLVASLSHPGGNVTGVTAINAELVSKWLSLAGDLVPQVTIVGFLSGDSSYLAFYEDQKSQILAAARALGRQVIILETRSDLDYEPAFKTLVQREVGALIVGPFAFRNTNEILTLPARYKIPTLPPSRLRRGGRSDELRRRLRRHLSPSRRLHRPDSCGRQAGRPAGHAGDKARTGHQPQDRQSAWPRNFTHAARHRPRGDRMRRRTFITLFWRCSCIIERAS
jgi:putative tryptophan/tyrosine transport system substrate-binding protein